MTVSIEGNPGGAGRFTVERPPQAGQAARGLEE
jgi:hypothetical protein